MLCLYSNLPFLDIVAISATTAMHELICFMFFYFAEAISEVHRVF